MIAKIQQLEILEALKEKGFLNDDDFLKFKDMLNEGKDALLEIDKNKKIDDEDKIKIEANVLGFKYKSLKNFKIDPKLFKIIPTDLATNYQLVVFAKEKNILKVGIVDPTDLKAQEAVDYMARENELKVEYYLISKKTLDNLLKQYSELKGEVSEALGAVKGRIEEKEEKIEKQKEQEGLEDLEGTVKNAPVAKIVSVILKHGVDGKASDIHIEPYSDGSRVRYRIDGILHTSLILPKYIHTALVSRIKVLANLKIDETRVPQDGRIRLNILGKNVDFRVSTLPLYDSEKVVMRILDTSGGTFSLDQLGFNGYNLDVIKETIKKPNGLFLVTGPTGSGKSTTLYSVLNILNQEGVNIVTLEDPVEYYLTGVNQSQIRPEVGLTFATGLRSILRQDPDIIMVGEIRDNETAELAIHAALTGHIVLSTLHTNDAFGAIPRLMDMKVESFLLSSTLNVIVAQRLVRKICPDCKEEVELPKNKMDEVLEEINKIPKKSFPEELKNIKHLKFYKGKGCATCGQTGYKGRVGIVEVLAMTDNLKNIVASGSQKGIKEEALAQGMISMKQDGIIKAIKGLTTVEEILRVTKE